MENELDFATALAEKAGKLLCEHFQRENIDTRYKADHTVVTEADVAADRLIAAEINAAFPADGILSEELQPDYQNVGEGIGLWIVDPLDGTTNFSLGLHHWGVLLARLVDGLPQVSAQYFPVIGEMYSAASGRGAYLNGERIHVEGPNPDRPAAFFSCCSRTHRRYQVKVPYKTRILGSAAYTLCAVARGMALVGFEATPKIWDIAAGWLLVQEAGGIVETLDGSQPFPVRPQVNYARQSFPVLSAATVELAETSRRQILPR